MRRLTLAVLRIPREFRGALRRVRRVDARKRESARNSAEIVFNPVADAYVSTAHPDSNYGIEPTLRADATPKIRSDLRFRLDGVSGQVVTARLRLWSPTGDLAGYSFQPVPGAPRAPRLGRGWAHGRSSLRWALAVPARPAGAVHRWAVSCRGCAVILGAAR